ncbi:hypothetical protein CKO50_17105 [Pseudoalteromonas sp. HM-SA03]|uniref:hypothetical protein n=1 Tax=Pseudoalteromonas sp. HM-SA03 TaxID=2029678 RepID=UPI000BADF8D2|nr:hypothetical protein [Pseudoalteromonas sp. HM-SA03]PAY00143.1 hypothetical protein CKO50_17105 [Pseudoalteromonas sp. HM-SA03]
MSDTFTRFDISKAIGYLKKHPEFEILKTNYRLSEVPEARKHLISFLKASDTVSKAEARTTSLDVAYQKAFYILDTLTTSGFIKSSLARRNITSSSGTEEIVFIFIRYDLTEKGSKFYAQLVSSTNSTKALYISSIALVIAIVSAGVSWRRLELYQQQLSSQKAEVRESRINKQ